MLRTDILDGLLTPSLTDHLFWEAGRTTFHRFKL